MVVATCDGDLGNDWHHDPCRVGMLIDAILSTLESTFDAVRWLVLNPHHKLFVVLVVVEFLRPVPVIVPPFHKREAYSLQL